jgi:2-polyprenyl-6-methoxyphenol hydroxylase-like FAD-dependent oxidoreductase
MAARGVSPDPVLIVGAGPVGLLLANLLGARGIRTEVFEREAAPPRTSRAIGITPPSLAILADLGLDHALVKAGVPVRTAVVHGSRRRLGTVRFAGLPVPWPFILAVPQARTENLLRRNLARFPSVTLHSGASAETVCGDGGTASVSWRDRAGHRHTQRGTWLCLCEGDRGRLREALAMDRPARRYPDTFLMADFTDHSGLGDGAHLFFTRRGAVESFPLPDGKRRWVIQTGGFIEAPDSGYLERVVAARTGYRLAARDKRWESPFGVKRRHARCWASGRIVLCGDAAHVFPPIGGQGMNTGFADAALLARTLEAILHGNAAAGPALQNYQRTRSRAARAAARRAWLSMRIGTIEGRCASTVRNLLIRLALASPLGRLVPPHFAMLTIPGNRKQ